jgi:hypothetical protein
VEREKEKEEERLTLTKLSKSEYAAQQSNLRKQNSQPSFQAIFGTGKEVWSPETVQKPVGDIEDRASVAGE